MACQKHAQCRAFGKKYFTVVEHKTWTEKGRGNGNVLRSCLWHLKLSRKLWNFQLCAQNKLSFHLVSKLHPQFLKERMKRRTCELTYATIFSKYTTPLRSGPNVCVSLVTVTRIEADTIAVTFRVVQMATHNCIGRFRFILQQLVSSQPKPFSQQRSLTSC